MSGPDTFWCWIICTAIVSVSSCTAIGAYARIEAEPRKTPQQMCVERALFNSDRLDCLKAGTSAAASPTKSEEE